jgi:branched-subunit amino acid transport protein
VTDVPSILLMALAVFLPKAVPLLLVPERIAPSVRRWLDYVAPAVLAALVAPSIVLENGEVAAPRWEHLAFTVTFAVAVWTRRMLPSLASGVAVLLLGLLLQPNG